MPDQNDTNTTQPTVDPATPAAPVSTPTDPATPAEPTAPTEPTEPEEPTPIIPNEAVDQPAPMEPNPAPIDSNPAPTNPDSDIAEPAGPESEPVASDNSDIIVDVATKISEAQNILIALSSDPSVDEMCAAIGLTLFLDKLGKRVTAIYSGNTPNALEFLKPERSVQNFSLRIWKNNFD